MTTKKHKAKDVLLINEVLDQQLKNKARGMLCKLDMGKTYDNVNSAFLLAILHWMGFGEKWIYMGMCLPCVSLFLLMGAQLHSLGFLRG